MTMNQFRHYVLIAAMLLAGSASAHAIGPMSALEERLKAMAAADPAVAQLLEDLAARRESQTYDAESFGKHVGVEMTAFQIAPGGKYVMTSSGGTAWGTPNSRLGNVIEHIDRTTGEQQDVHYDAKIDYTPEKGLTIELTIRVGDEKPQTKTHVIENFAPLTVVAKELPDGSRYVVRLTPVIEARQRVVEYANELPLSLDSAVLIRDQAFLGTFSCSGGVVGITSGKAGMKFEFGLKAFRDAQPIGRTDGKTIWFEHDGHNYELHNAGGEIPMPIRDDVLWKVYVRAGRAFGGGDGTSSSGYDSLKLSELLMGGNGG